MRGWAADSGAQTSLNRVPHPTARGHGSRRALRAPPSCIAGALPLLCHGACLHARSCRHLPTHLSAAPASLLPVQIDAGMNVGCVLAGHEGTEGGDLLTEMSLLAPASLPSALRDVLVDISEIQPPR